MNPLQRWRERVRRTRAGRLVLRVVVLLLGAFFVALGIALVVLPGPLTIPPILLGVYLWSTEFAWAERLRDRAAASARDAWEAAKRRPASSAAVTAAGLVFAVAAALAVQRYDVVDRVTSVFG